jgi:hypothetical protein
VRVRPDEDVVADFERVIGHLATGKFHWRANGGVGTYYSCSVWKSVG